MTDVIVAEELTKDYDGTRALDGLTLAVKRGEIFGFLGPNGAGKTTSIRLLLDVIRPTDGQVSVLGLDPQRDGVEIRRRVGYLPGDFVVDGRQTSDELLTYVGNLRGGVDKKKSDALAERLDLDVSLPIRSLSKGNRQKVGLVQAFMHEPELLILDEPTSGLDPLIQRIFLEMAVEAKAAGQTVFMSSHVLSEVQQVADRAAVIRRGRLVALDDVESLRERSVRRVEVVFDGPVPPGDFAHVEGAEDIIITDSLLQCRITGRADALIKALARHSVVSILSEEPDLEEMFFHYYAEERDDRAS
jgi:ABC-2 type transport system ATP-binding protein